jgi:hypothetical protein
MEIPPCKFGKNDYFGEIIPQQGGFVNTANRFSFFTEQIVGILCENHLKKAGFKP